MLHFIDDCQLPLHITEPNMPVNLLTSTYLHTSSFTCLLACMLVCLLTFLQACLHRRPNCPIIKVNSNRPKSHISHPLNFHRLYFVNFKFMIYLPCWGGSLLCSVTQIYPLPPKITKQTIHQLPTDHIWLISSCISTFLIGWGWLGGWVRVTFITQSN